MSALPAGWWGQLDWSLQVLFIPPGRRALASCCWKLVVDWPLFLVVSDVGPWWEICWYDNSIRTRAWGQGGREPVKGDFYSSGDQRLYFALATTSDLVPSRWQRRSQAGNPWIMEVTEGSLAMLKWNMLSVSICVIILKIKWNRCIKIITVSTLQWQDVTICVSMFLMHKKSNIQFFCVKIHPNVQLCCLENAIPRALKLL